jgi:hypothetical protein
VAVLAGLAGIACGGGGTLATPPNVILVSIDTLRADRLNAYGYRERTLSPALDRLAGEGVLFENHISASPWTTPSHLSLLTSLSPSAHGVTAPFNVLMEGLEHGHRYQRLAPEHVTLADVGLHRRDHPGPPDRLCPGLHPLRHVDGEGERGRLRLDGGVGRPAP